MKIPKSFVRKVAPTAIAQKVHRDLFDGELGMFEYAFPARGKRIGEVLLRETIHAAELKRNSVDTGEAALCRFLHDHVEHLVYQVIFVHGILFQMMVANGISVLS